MNANLDHYLKKGLSSVAAQKLFDKYGPNQIKNQKSPSNLVFIIAQLKNPLVLVLIVAAAITLLLNDISDTIVILLAVIVNTFLGYYQEKKAHKSMESLKSALAYQAWVVRDGIKKEIDTKQIVPSDLVWIYQGDIIPADAVILETDSILINEAIITGEADAIIKTSYHPKLNPDQTLLNHISKHQKQLDPTQKVFAGTNVVSGSALIFITQTGLNTQMGQIAESISQHISGKTPLEKRLDSLAKFITLGVIFISIGIFIYGISFGRTFADMFALSVALAVAAIPEGLIIALTAILAVGMQRILKKNALVRSLMAAETLGTVNCICVDKTGTLTQGELKVVDTHFTNPVLAYKASLIAKDMRDSIEISRWQWAQKISKKNPQFLSPQDILDDNPKEATIPFSSETRFLATRVKNEIFISGSPEELLKKSSLSKKLISQPQTLINSLSSQGKRLLGFGYIKAKSETQAIKIFNQLKKVNFKNIKLTWLGLMAFTDPIRKDVAKTIKKAQQAGVDFKIITGDFKNTAISVAQQIGLDISDNQIIEGKELNNLNSNQLSQLVNQVVLFARTTPSQKLKIVNALKKNHKVIGMMGDGVNDAPALAAADIGMVVAQASQISKDAADIVLLDSNLKTIIDAIEEGRAIFDNLRKIILYLLSDTFSEFILIIFSILIGLPATITASQILWINLINDGLPSLALTLDPKSKDLLKRKPISQNEPIINREIRIIIILASIVSALSSLIAFMYAYPKFGYVNARTIVFAIMALDSLFYIYSCKNLSKNIWHDHVFNNKHLNIAVFISLILIILPIYLPFLQNLLKTSALSLFEWLIVVVFSLSVIAVIEFVKFIYHQLNKSATK